MEVRNITPTPCFHYPRDICGSSQELDGGPFIFYDSSLERWRFGHGFLQHFSLNYQIYRQPPRHCATAPLLFCSPSLSGCKRVEPWVKVIRTWPGWRLVFFFQGWNPKVTMYTVYPKHARNFHIETNIGCNCTSSKPSFLLVFMWNRHPFLLGDLASATVGVAIPIVGQK